MKQGIFRSRKDEMKWAITQFPLGPTLKQDYPEVEAATRFVAAGKTMYKNDDMPANDFKSYINIGGLGANAGVRWRF